MTAPALFGQMTALADPTRSRLLLALERNELTVNELRTILQLPQSTISRHLKMLGAESWVEARAEGTSRHYRLASDSLDPASRRLWHIVRDEVLRTSAAEHDARRTQAVLAERSTRSQQFFSTSAGQWDKMRLELFGRRADIALLGLLDESWTVADLGCGTGAVAHSLAPFVKRVIAVDESTAMLSAARKRLHGVENVDIRSGRLEALPLDDGEVDVALLFLVLHYVADPAKVISEASRALRPGGRLLVLDMMPHDRQDLRQLMGHLWQGFDRATLGGWMTAAGLEGFRYSELPADPEAKGPSLFAASGKRSAAASKTASRKKADAVPLMKTA
ncbi:MAG TPA: metalloregulator ArsR/SmtB family transcription factor [Gemmatimonadaceae bacterium]|jgi:ArsR family transcriptional regulator|nr:metalloregulator ArsR/SmtB family transcription factor [Gemmatimonadaceae bacterium]